MKEFKIAELKELAHAITNHLYVSDEDYKYFYKKANSKKPIYIEIKNSVFILNEADYI